jgi:hypothetical protein
MKRLSYFLFGLFLASTVMAQEKPIITSAVVAWQKPVSKSTLEEAKMYIDKAKEVIDGKQLAEVNPKQLGKFYFHYGDIYFRIANGSSPEIKALDADAIDKALWGYQKLLDFEKNSGKKTYSKTVLTNMLYVVGNVINRGIQHADQQDYESAMNDFLLAFELKKNEPFNSLDTIMLYNAAITAQSLEDKSKALELYLKLIELNYNGITYSARNAKTGEPVAYENAKALDKALAAGEVLEPKIGESILPSLYISVATIAKSMGNKELSDKIIGEGRAKFPKENDLILLELQDFLDKGDFNGAMRNLKLALEKDPTNSLYWYNIGVIYQTKMNQLDSARWAYEKTIEVDSRSFDAMYMLGVSYVAEANDYSEKMNKLSLREEKKFNQLKKEQQSVFKKSYDFFKMAYGINPKDKDVLNALQEISYKIGDMENALKYKEELEGIE